MFALTLWLAIVYVSRYVSLGSIAAAFATLWQPIIWAMTTGWWFSRLFVRL